jgi:hypothetical protein
MPAPLDLWDLAEHRPHHVLEAAQAGDVLPDPPPLIGATSALCETSDPDGRQDMRAPTGLHRTLAIAAIAILGVTAAGCGGGSESTDHPPLSKRTFLFLSNAICKQGNGELNAAFHKQFGKGQPSQAEIAAFVNDYFAPIVQKQIDDIRVVGLPQGSEDQVSRILDTGQQDLDTVKSDPSLLIGKQDAFASFKKLAHPYGLTKCAKG